MKDEGPSSEDLDRFGGDTITCPSCGEDVWHDAMKCHACGQSLHGGASTGPSSSHAIQHRVTIVIIILLILGLLASYRWIV